MDDSKWHSVLHAASLTFLLLLHPIDLLCYSLALSLCLSSFYLLSLPSRFRDTTTPLFSYEFCRMMKRRFFFPPIVVTTNNILDDYMERCLDYPIS